MSKQQAPHDKNNPFTIISNKTIDDPTLPIVPKMVLIYLLRFPVDWVIRVPVVAKGLGVGEDMIYSAFKILIDRGFLKRQDHFVNGLKRGCTYFVFEWSVIEDSKNVCDIGTHEIPSSPKHTKDLEETNINPLPLKLGASKQINTKRAVENIKVNHKRAIQLKEHVRELYNEKKAKQCVRLRRRKVFVTLIDHTIITLDQYDEPDIFLKRLRECKHLFDVAKSPPNDYGNATFAKT